MGCFEDSCSVKWNEVTTGTGRKYQSSLELADFGSIKCSEDAIEDIGAGLFVDLLNDAPADTTRQCANLLRRTSAGELYAQIPLVVQVASVNSGYASVPQTASSSSPAGASLDFSYFNNSGCDQLILLRGQFNISYAILRENSGVANTPGQMRRVTSFATPAPPGAIPGASPALLANLTPFNAQWNARLRRGITGPGSTPNAPVVSQHMETSGVVVDLDVYDSLKSEWVDFTWIEEVRNGATITFTGDVFFDGPDQTINVVASGTPAEPPGPTTDIGFRIHNCDLFALPLQVL